MQRQLLHLLQQLHVHFQQVHTVLLHFIGGRNAGQVLVLLDVGFCVFQRDEGVVFFKDVIGAFNSEVYFYFFCLDSAFDGEFVARGWGSCADAYVAT